MLFYVDLLTTMSLGLLIGVEFAVAAFVDPVLWRLDDRSQAYTLKAFANKLGTVMPPWYAANLLLLIIEALVRRHNPGAPFLFTACILWALVIVLTIVFLVPINNRLGRMQDDVLSSNEKQAHRKWDTGHRFRVATLIVALTLFLCVLL
jgi:uncharacterized membrane protein